MRRIVGRTLAAVVATVAGGAMTPSPAAAQTVSPAIPGRIAIAADVFDRVPPGYVVGEHFVSGVARSYRVAGGDGPQARIAESGEAPYRTRIVVVRPVDPARFNGTVVLEWNNVTSSADAAPDWNYLHRELTRSGYAYVAVTTQRAGLEGGGVSQSGLKPVKQADPQRYGGLDHPGDAFSYDIYSQAARLVRAQAPALFGGLKPQRVLGIGESQSAAFLVTYVNAVDPLARAFDGFLIHSRFRGGAQVNGDFRASLTHADAAVPVEVVKIRPDVRVPVLTFITETDLLFATAANPSPPNVGYLAARQPDGPRLRTWELAGAAHADTYTIWGGLDDGQAPAEVLAKAFTPMDNLFGTPLNPSINAAPQEHYVLQSALAALNHWVATGRAPAERHRGGQAAVGPGRPGERHRRDPHPLDGRAHRPAFRIRPVRERDAAAVRLHHAVQRRPTRAALPGRAGGVS
jgi:hypothetical protein